MAKKPEFEPAQEPEPAQDATTSSMKSPLTQNSNVSYGATDVEKMLAKQKATENTGA